MEQNKLKKLALILQDEFSESSLQDLWVRYKGYAKTHSDYFSKLNVHSFLKVFIYIYSLLKTNDFKLADNILENMFFSYLFQRGEETFTDDCGRCAGDGNVECYDCDGIGNESCNDCDGEGEIDCSECEGKGEIEDESGDMVECPNCDGSGKEECSECDGDGTVDCSSCGGNGKNECDECYGSGSIEEEDKYEYFTFFVCSWNKDFYNRCELTENKMEPTINDDDFDDLSEKLILSENSDYQYLDTEMEVDDMYCLYVSDTPNLYLGYNFELKLGWIPSIDNFKV
jgi:hypothetical protein